MSEFVIRSTLDPSEFWHNEYGWVDLATADRFSQQDQAAFNLPMYGTWVALQEPQAG